MALSYKQSVIVRFEYYLYQIGKFWDPIRGVYKKLHAREKVLSDNLTPHPHPDENPTMQMQIENVFMERTTSGF